MPNRVKILSFLIHPSQTELLIKDALLPRKWKFLPPFPIGTGYRQIPLTTTTGAGDKLFQFQGRHHVLHEQQVTIISSPPGR